MELYCKIFELFQKDKRILELEKRIKDLITNKVEMKKFYRNQIMKHKIFIKDEIERILVNLRHFDS